MSMRVEGECRAPLERRGGDWFAVLPDELMQLIFGYMTIDEGYRFLEASTSKKEFNNRMIKVVRRNQEMYLRGLYEKVVGYFSFLSPKYEDHLKTEAQKALKKALNSKTVRTMYQNSILFEKVLRKGVSSTDTWIWPEFFFLQYKEKIDYMLSKIGRILVGSPIWVTPPSIEATFELAEKDELTEEKRELYLEIFGAYKSMDVERRLNLIQKIKQQERKERAMIFLFWERCWDISLIEQDQFFNALPLRAQVRYLSHRKEMTNRVITCLEQIREEGREQRRKALFLELFEVFPWYIKETKKEFSNETIVSKMREVLQTFPRGRAGGAVFELFHQALDMPIEILLDCRQMSDAVIKYLQSLGDQKRLRPLEMLELGIQVNNQMAQTDGGCPMVEGLKKLFIKGVKLSKDLEESFSLVERVFEEVRLWSNGWKMGFLKTILCYQVSDPLEDQVDKNLYLDKIVAMINAMQDEEYTEIEKLVTGLAQSLSSEQNVVEEGHRKSCRLAKCNLQVYLVAGLVQECISGERKDKAIVRVLNAYRKKEPKRAEVWIQTFSLIEEITDLEKKKEIISTLTAKEIALLINCEEASVSDEDFLDWIENVPPSEELRDYVIRQAVQAISNLPARMHLLNSLCNLIHDSETREKELSLLEDRRKALLIMHPPEMVQMVVQGHLSPEELLPIILADRDSYSRQTRALIAVAYAGIVACRELAPQGVEAFIRFFQESLGKERYEDFLTQIMVHDTGFAPDYEAIIKSVLYESFNPLF